MDDARRDEVLAEINEAAREWLDGALIAYPDGFDIGTIGIAFDIPLPGRNAKIGYFCSDGREWVHAGLFRSAMLEADGRGHEPEAEDTQPTSAVT